MNRQIPAGTAEQQHQALADAGALVTAHVFSGLEESLELYAAQLTAQLDELVDDVAFADDQARRELLSRTFRLVHHLAVISGRLAHLTAYTLGVEVERVLQQVLTNAAADAAGITREARP